MVFKTICVGSIPAIFVIFILTKSQLTQLSPNNFIKRSLKTSIKNSNNISTNSTNTKTNIVLTKKNKKSNKALINVKHKKTNTLLNKNIYKNLNNILSDTLLKVRKISNKTIFKLFFKKVIYFKKKQKSFMQISRKISYLPIKSPSSNFKKNILSPYKLTKNNKNNVFKFNIKHLHNLQFKSKSKLQFKILKNYFIKKNNLILIKSQSIKNKHLSLKPSLNNTWINYCKITVFSKKNSVRKTRKVWKSFWNTLKNQQNFSSFNYLNFKTNNYQYSNVFQKISIINPHTSTIKSQTFKYSLVEILKQASKLQNKIEYRVSYSKLKYLHIYDFIKNINFKKHSKIKNIIFVPKSNQNTNQPNLDRKIRHELNRNVIYPKINDQNFFFMQSILFMYSCISEDIFIQKFKQNKRKPIRVLSTAPYYKLDSISAITADRFRGNTYKRLGFNQKYITSMDNIHYTKSLFTFTNQIYKTFKTFTNKNTIILASLWKTYLEEKKHIYRSYFINSKNNIFSQKNAFLFLNLFITQFAVNKKKKQKFLSVTNFNFKSKNFFKYRKFTYFSSNYFLVKKRRRKLKKRRIKIRKKLIPKKINLHLLTVFQKKIMVKNRYEKFIRKKYTNFILRLFEWKITKKKQTLNSLKRMNRTRRNYINQKIFNLQSNNKKILLQTNLQPRKYFLTNFNTKNGNNFQNYLKKNLYFSKTYLSNVYFLLNQINTNLILKTNIILLSSKHLLKTRNLLIPSLNKFLLPSNLITNIIPQSMFNKVLNKKILSSFTNKNFDEDIIPWYYHTLIRFIENCSGRKVIFQFYPFVNQSITYDYIMRYKRWLPRMAFYERNLGHRFFLEEALNLIHLSFVLRDPKIFLSWLKAMILRISFWKTRSIFRFIKYLFHNYFRFTFSDLKIYGLKIKLKGKISAAGNSRKRTILYRVGKTSHSATKIRVLNELSTVNTFTGVMGLSVSLFY